VDATAEATVFELEFDWELGRFRHDHVLLDHLLDFGPHFVERDSSVGPFSRGGGTLSATELFDRTTSREANVVDMNQDMTYTIDNNCPWSL
jgi:hypothetical protein